MSDNRATGAGADVQLGARARSILRTLADGRPAKIASRFSGPRQRSDDDARRGEAALVAPTDDAASARMARRASRGVPAEAADASPPAAAQETKPRNTVVPLPRRDGRRAPAKVEAIVPPPALRPTPGRRKKSFIGLSAWLAIALPTLLGAVYYGFIAAPQYVAEARFAVRGPDDSPVSAGDALGALSGMSAGAMSTASDSFIVAQFVESAQLVQTLQRSLDLRAAYTHENADFLARYRPYDFEDSIEHLTTFWNSVSWVYYEPISGIITFTVRAFTPEDALRISRETIRESEKLVNKLSERAREDAISVAKQEQSRAELRLKFARKAVQDYRDRQGATDPNTVATAQSALIAGLETQLAGEEAELTASKTFLNADAPSVRVLRNKVEALKQRIAAERAKIGSTAAGDQSKLISASMAEFENLATERDFATKAYEAASLQVEGARMRAEKQSRYLTTFVQPHLPEDSLYPARLQMILLILLCSTLAWGIGVLIFYGIRDHSA